MSTDDSKSKEAPVKTPQERESSAADEMESEMEDRDDARIEGERVEQGDLNQGMATGTTDSAHGGVNWPASYTIHDRAAKPVPSPKDQKKDPDSKG
jgi:hypothetical protein